MEDEGSMVSPQHLQEVLLHLKYLGAVRRVARGVAHGYNNIFTGLGGQISLLQRRASALKDVSSRRNNLVDELLRRGIEQTKTLYDFTKESNSDHHIHYPAILAAKAVDLLSRVSREHHVIVADLQEEHQKFICNGREVLLILLYLGENCIDATPEGGSVFLDILSSPPGDGLEPPSVAFRFRDRGPGLPEEIRKRLGEPFITTRNDSPASGLGLYSAIILARRNNGNLVHTRNRAGESETCVRFPFVAEEVDQSVKVHEETGSQNDEPTEIGKQCFLVVDDDKGVRSLLLTRLQRRGHMVFCVKSCAEAIDEYALLHNTITIIMMDVGLRDASGYDCCRKMMAINPNSKVIFMSGMEEEIPADLAVNAAFLQKPFTINQIEKAVRDVQLQKKGS